MNPYQLMLEWQMAVAKSWMASFELSMRMWGHLAGTQAELLHEQPHHRRRTRLSRGPTLDDHYGRRCHDIDVEHDV